MDRHYRHIEIKSVGDICCVHLAGHRFAEETIDELRAEVEDLIRNRGCLKLVMSLGRLECLYSKMIEMLVRIHRDLNERGGTLRLCDVAPETLGVFAACRLQDYFAFEPNEAAAIAAFGAKTPREP